MIIYLGKNGEKDSRLSSSEIGTKAIFFSHNVKKEFFLLQQSGTFFKEVRPFFSHWQTDGRSVGLMTCPPLVIINFIAQSVRSVEVGNDLNGSFEASEKRYFNLFLFTFLGKRDRGKKMNVRVGQILPLWARREQWDTRLVCRSSVASVRPSVRPSGENVTRTDSETADFSTTRLANYSWRVLTFDSQYYILTSCA